MLNLPLASYTNLINERKSWRWFLLCITLFITGCGGESADSDAPHVVSAISISNTEVLVQFSKTVVGGLDGAENPANYSIATAASSNATVGGEDGEDNPTGGGTATVGQTTHLPIHAAVFSNRQSSTVLLTTSSQSSTNYKVTVINIHDEFGTSIEVPSIAVDPSSANFVGTDPGAAANIDSDGDGLRDHVELLGWTVIITNTNGTLSTRHVSSDPGDPNQAVDSPTNMAARDTDSDGVTDNEELHGGMDPRNPDSDGDTLTDNQEWNVIYSDPTNQDTDGDGTQDGFEFYSFRTSPVLADTDGDQITDTDEVLGRNRDPRIADLPLHGIVIGDVRLQIDERYTYEDATGVMVSSNSSTNVTLTQSETSAQSLVSEHFTEAVLGLTAGLEFKPPKFVPDTVTVGAEVGYKGGSKTVISSESAAESQRVREESISNGKEQSSTSTVTREILGASIDVDLSITNQGDLAFSISNLEVTVLQRSRVSTSRFDPVATLVANSTLITGTPATFNIGPFTNGQGPILFSSRDVFPNLVDQLMESPSGLIFEIAKFDITDEFGRLFSFSNQIARDRTGGIIVDSGDGIVERKLVATALQPDPDGNGGPAGQFVGGFNGDGSPKGIPIDFALQDIMELTKNGTVVDGITAGPNQTADSFAQGDDVQLIPPYTTGINVGSIVVSAGEDGILQSVTFGDDLQSVTTGYETSSSCSAPTDTTPSFNPREICVVDTDCDRDLDGDELGSCTGPEILVRFGSQRTGDFDRKWVVLTTGQIPAGASFGQLVVKPGEDLYFAFVQDLDEDGIFAREEFLNGSIDSRANIFDNSTFGKIAPFTSGDKKFELLPASTPAGSDTLFDSKDTDRDGLGDYAEIRVGWKVAADGGLLQQVFSSPRLADSDGDGLLDPQEQDLRSFCFSPFGEGVALGLPDDGRIDALCSFESAPPVIQADAIAIIAGPNGIVETEAVAGDQQLIPLGTTGLTFGTPLIGPGQDDFISTTLNGDDEYVSIQSSTRIPPASNPIQSDTDLDGIEDFTELTQFLVGHNIKDGAGFGSGESSPEHLSQTQAIGDDIQQAYLGGPVSSQGVVVLPGPNGTIESTPGGDDVLDPGVLVATDPLRRDTDGDLVADGVELAKGGNPRNTLDGDEFKDSDQDGLSDSEESTLGWLVSVNGGTATQVLSNPSRPDSDFDGLPDFAERILRTDPNKADTDGDGLTDFDEVAGVDFEQFIGLEQQFPNFFVDGASSKQYGTNPNNIHSDTDGLSDYVELIEGYRVLIAGESSFRQVYTNPLVDDTDLDGVPDNSERLGNVYGQFPYTITDATDPDTDDDGRSDGLEDLKNTNPLEPDISITVTYKRLLLDKITDTGGSGGAELQWFFMVKRPGDLGNGILLSDAADCVYSNNGIRNLECGYGFPNPFPDPSTGQACGQFQARSDTYYTLNLGLGRVNPTSDYFRYRTGQSSFALKEGESFSVNGIIWETDIAPNIINSPDCGLPPFYTPSNVVGGCTTRFDETFRFEDLVNNGQGTFPLPNGVGTDENCKWTIDVEVVVD